MCWRESEEITEITDKDLLTLVNSYIGAIEKGEITYLQARDYFLKIYSRNSNWSNKNSKYKLLYLLDMVQLFDFEYIKLKELIDSFIKSPLDQEIDKKYDLAFKLLFFNIVVKFESLVGFLNINKENNKKYKKVFYI